MPTTRHGSIRRLLRHNRTSVVRDVPFTVQLHDTQDNETQPLVLAIDPGHTIGAAVIRHDGIPLFFGEFETRSDEIPDLMQQRAASRRMRRQHRRDKCKRRAKHAETTFGGAREFRLQGTNDNGDPFGSLLCKAIKPKLARINNRKRDDKWLTPTAKHLLYSHIRVIDYLCGLLPISRIVLEYAQFDLQKIENPDIRGEEYQQGRMLGYKNVEQYVLERDRHLCQLCRKHTQKHLHVHHVIWRRHGGADTPENLVTLCHECHELVHVNPSTNQRLQEKFKGMKKRFVHTTLLNTILPFLYRWLQFSDIPVSRTYGYITKYYRKEWNIDKSHALDAYVMAVRKANAEPNGYKETQVYHFMQFRRHKRGLVSRVEDRKYYVEQNGKRVCVAKNRGQGRTGQTDKPSLGQYHEEYGESAVAALTVGTRGKGKKAMMDKTVSWNPGDVVRYHGQRKVLKGTRNKGRELGFVGEKNYVKAKECRLLYKNPGIVCIGKQQLTKE